MANAKPDHRRRDKQMTFWVTVAERDRIRENAERAGVTPSAYVRGLALGEPMTPKPRGQAKELIRQLNRIGNNLNQLQRHTAILDGVALDCLRHVYDAVVAALTQWSESSPPIALSPEQVARLQHAGGSVNQLARQANRDEPVEQTALLDALKRLTGELRQVTR